MNRLPRLIPGISLLLILTLPLAAQSATQSPPPSASDYGIDLSASYPGAMVLDLLVAAEEEAGASINEAYAAGYKAGLLAAAPDAAYWKTQAALWKAEAERRFLPGDLRGFAPLAATLSIGLGLGLALGFMGK